MEPTVTLSLKDYDKLQGKIKNLEREVVNLRLTLNTTQASMQKNIEATFGKAYSTVIVYDSELEKRLESFKNVNADLYIIECRL